VVRPRSPAVAVTSDLGYCLTPHRTGGAGGYAVPLRPDAILVLRVGPRCLQVRWTDHEWIVEGIQQATSAPEDVANFNAAIAGEAVEVYGPTEQAVNTCARAWERDQPTLPHGPGPGWLTPNPRILPEQEHYRLRLLSLIATPPAEGAPSIVRMR
jgi:hypothetical protein